MRKGYFPAVACLVLLNLASFAEKVNTSENFLLGLHLQKVSLKNLPCRNCNLISSSLLQIHDIYQIAELLKK